MNSAGNIHIWIWVANIFSAGFSMNEVFKIYREKIYGLLKSFTCQNSCLTSIFRQFWNLEYHGKKFILFVFYGITILHGQNIDRRMDTITSRDRCVIKKNIVWLGPVIAYSIISSRICVNYVLGFPVNNEKHEQNQCEQCMNIFAEKK